MPLFKTVVTQVALPHNLLSLLKWFRFEDMASRSRMLSVAYCMPLDTFFIIGRMGTKDCYRLKRRNSVFELGLRFEISALSRVTSTTLPNTGLFAALALTLTKSAI